MEEDRARWAELIATSLQVSGLSEEDLERRLGWPPGSLAPLLEGRNDLEPTQILQILAELDEDSRRVRGEEAADSGRTPLVADLLNRFQRLGYEPLAVAPAPRPLTLRRLEKKVEDILRRAYGELSDEKSSGRK